MSDVEQENELLREDMQDGDDGFPKTGVVNFGTRRLPTVREKKLKKKSKSGGFETLGLSSEIYRGIKRKGYQIPTPIQRKTLSLILSGYDVVAMARTGSGKTAAFLIPMLEKLRSHSPRSGARAVILSPTRELALQTFKFTLELGKFTDLKACVLVGGDSMESQFEELSKNPDILIATPGRLMHHLSEVEGMNLRSVEFAVFDEADRLFEMGFAEQLRQIINQMSDIRQTLLFSATLPKLLAEFARAGLKDPQIVRLDSETTIHSDLKLAFYTMRHDEKVAVLLHLLREVISPSEQTLIFVSTKYHVDYLNEILLEEGFSASIVYGAMDQTARKIHVAKFRARKSMILLVTDVAARGIDIPLLDNVVNFDFPPKPKLFVHRTGRVARAGRKGFAYSFLTTDELPYLLDLHLFLSKPIKPAPTEEEIEKRSEVLDEFYLFASEDGTVYGRFPQPIIDLGMEKVREVMHKHSSIQSLHNVCSKAFKRYVQSRPPPSSQSIFRAKNLPSDGVHLSLRKELSKNDASASAFAEHLKKFRPRQTVLESEAEVQKKSKNNLKTVGFEAMQLKRKAHEVLILNKKKKEEENKIITEKLNKSLEKKEEKVDEEIEIKNEGKNSKKRFSESKEKTTNKRIKMENFRDEENYINSIPLNRFAERALKVKDLRDEKFDFGRMDSEILDLIPEDSEGISKKKSMYKWDKKGKKYIKLNAGEKMLPSGKVVNESGSKLNKGNHGLYEKWKQKSHKRISAFNEEEEGNINSSNGGKSSKFGGKKKFIPNAHVKDELKSVEQVRKSRQKTIAKGQKLHGKTSNLSVKPKFKGKGKGKIKGKGKGKSK